MPTIPEALALAVQHHQAGRLPIAEQLYRQILQVDPDQADAWHLLGVVHSQRAEYDRAAEAIHRAVELRPDDAAFHNNLGKIREDQGALEAAVVCYRRALELQPDYALAHTHLGNVLKKQGQMEAAVACHRRALALEPGQAMAHNNLGNALKAQGKLDEAVACYRRALELKPDYAKAHSNLLLALQYRAGVTLAQLAADHTAYDRLHAGPLRPAQRGHANTPDPHRRLRVGFVSPDFGRHPVGYFLVRCLENLDRDQLLTVCYSEQVVKDELTQRLQAAATAWHEVPGLSDDELTEQIRADRIDILFDLAGHSARNRLRVFARKAAPLQVTWAGYVGTTGLRAMDYILADRFEIPADAEPHYCERVLRMPDAYVCYDPPSDAPPVSALPARQQGYVTFGSFNNPAKINQQVIALWARLLRRLPHSRLVLKYRGMSDPPFAQGIMREFASHGIEPHRIECLGWSAHGALLAEYQRIDVALDPFPYNGGLTTCEALWMGVPVVTCPGETFAGRHSLTHLSNVGLTETIAGTLDVYVELAASLATDWPRLAAVRAGLRAQMAASPLCDGPRFAGNLTRVLRDVWQDWCRTSPAD